MSDVRLFTREELPLLSDLRVAVIRYAMLYVDRHFDPCKALDQKVADAEQAWTDLFHRLLLTARAGLVDSERLDVLIDWLSHHDDLEGSGIRDWDDNADARIAIDEKSRRPSRRTI